MASTIRRIVALTITSMAFRRMPQSWAGPRYWKAGGRVAFPRSGASIFSGLLFRLHFSVLPRVPPRLPVPRSFP